MFEARKSGVKVNLVPVSIKVYNDNLDIDSYQFNFDLVEVEILKPIDYEKYFELYCQSKDLTSKKEIMQRLIDNTLKPVANNLKYTYISHYMDLIKKDFIYFPDGKEISVKEANNIYYINKFKKEINRQVKILTKKLCI